MKFSDLTPEHFNTAKKYFYGCKNEPYNNFTYHYFILFKEINENSLIFTICEFGKEKDIICDASKFTFAISYYKHNGGNVETAIENSKKLINCSENKIIELNNYIEFLNTKSKKSITFIKQTIASTKREIKFLNKIIIDCKNLK
jgi:hypothetical protein